MELTDILTVLGIFIAANSPFYYLMVSLNKRTWGINERLARIEGALFPPTILSDRPRTEQRDQFRDPSLIGSR